MLVLNLLKARRAALTALDYDPAYPKFVTTASSPEIAEGTDEDTDAEQEADTAVAESDEIEDDPQQHTPIDVSDKINKIFNINNENSKKE